MKKCEPELSDILTELFSKCLKESCFSDCRKVRYVVPASKNVVERSIAKSCHSVRVLSVVSTIFEKLVNNRLVQRHDKSGIFSDFQYDFSINCRFSKSCRINKALNRPWATQAVPLDIFKTFNRVWHAGLLHKLKSCGISDWIFGLISSFLRDRQLWLVLDGKFSQEYPVYS